MMEIFKLSCELSVAVLVFFHVSRILGNPSPQRGGGRIMHLCAWQFDLCVCAWGGGTNGESGEHELSMKVSAAFINF